MIGELGQIREEARHLRGTARLSLEPGLALLDRTIGEIARSAAGEAELDRTRAQAEHELRALPRCVCPTTSGERASR